ncbi:hypothetical protein VMCG_07153 [Cytospora schulzeri]|uniref:Uncharacterized protein n=1 Tax=Cytospora schulzeri TaxID=448051 RepID=A0A423W4S2_9PEZI|nr:hypothetical protein VMCG_07153 [Valsa malicola]
MEVMMEVTIYLAPLIMVVLGTIMEWVDILMEGAGTFTLVAAMEEAEEDSVAGAEMEEEEEDSVAGAEMEEEAEVVLIRDDNGLLAARASSCLGEQLRLATLVHADEPEYRLLDGPTHRKGSVVLQQRRLLVPDAPRDVPALFSGKDYTVEGFVHGVVIVEGAGILGDDIQLAAQGTERSSIDRMGVAGCVDIWSGLMNRGVDRERCRVEKTVLAALEDLSFLVYPNQV